MYLLFIETLKGKHVLHCNENPIYVFPEKELRSLNSNSHIYVSVSDLYILRVGPHIFLWQNRHTDRGNIKSAHRHMNVEIRAEVCNSFSGNICFQFSILCLCSVATNHFCNCKSIAYFSFIFLSFHFFMSNAQS